MAYMAPEQIQGKAVRASDQYGLGVVVYEWLSGDLPFQGTMAEIASHHVNQEPPSLRAKVPMIPLAVEEVVLRALSKDPKKRFSNVKAFATALEEASGLDQVMQPSEFLPRLPIPLTPPLAPLGAILSTHNSHFDNVTAVAWSPNGKYIASASYDQTVQVWDVTTGRNIITYGGHYPLGVYTVAWAPDGKRLASGSWDKTVQVWDASTGSTLVTYRGHSSWVRTVAWAPDGKYVASAGHDQTVQVWNASTGRNLLFYNGHSNVVNSIAWSPDGNYIASAGKDNTVQIWNATTGKRVNTYRGHSDQVNSVAWSPDSTYITSAGEDGTVQVVDAAAGNQVTTYKHLAGVTTVAWSPNGTRIASGSWDSTVQMWDVTTERNIFTYRGHSAGVYALAWSPDCTRIASGSWDNTVQVWQALGQSKQPEATIDRTRYLGSAAQQQDYLPTPGYQPTIKGYDPNPYPWGSPLPTNPPTFLGSNASQADGKPQRQTASDAEKSEIKETQLTLFAITRALLEADDRAFIGRIYSIQAGISQSKPENFEGEPFDLTVPDVTNYIPFDILLHESENIELSTEWHKRLLYNPNDLKPQLVDFTFQVIVPGHSILVIDFYQDRRWLRTARIEFDSIEQPQLATLPLEV